MNTIRCHSHRRAYLAAMAIPTMLIGFSLSATSAQAGYIVTLSQEGPNVVGTGSGTIDTTDLTLLRSVNNTGFGLIGPGHRGDSNRADGHYSRGSNRVHGLHWTNKFWERVGGDLRE
jgi:hypothetical protein